MFALVSLIACRAVVRRMMKWDLLLKVIKKKMRNAAQGCHWQRDAAAAL